MSKVVATTVLPEDSGEVLTFGDTGDAIAISGASLNLNKLQDAGGNNIFTSDGSGNLTINSGLGGAMNLLTTNIFTGTTTSNFTTLIDSTYDVYCFKFTDINPATDETFFSFQVNRSGQSGYDETMTTTYFGASNDEGGAYTGELTYMTAYDQANGTAYQYLSRKIGNGADECAAGTLWLYAPSSTVFMKQFYSRANNYYHDDYAMDTYVAGYVNTTSAIDEISFKMSSGNMDGEIKMYGINKS